MEKENGESNLIDGIGGNGNSSKGDTSSLLDAASLFGGINVFLLIKNILNQINCQSVSKILFFI